MKTRSTTVALIALILVLAGCGGGDDEESTPTLDAAQIDKIENTLKSALASSGDQGAVDVETVECPDDVEQKADEEFECDVRRSDGEGTVTVTLIDERGTDISYEGKIANTTFTGRQDVSD